MGAAVLIGIPLAIILNQDDHHVQVVDRLTSSSLIGGTLKNVTSQQLVNLITEVAIPELDALLRKNGVPEKDIQEKAPKLKIVKNGHIESLSFVLDGTNFEAKLIVIKSSKTDQGKLKIKLNIDNFRAQYQQPQIQQNYSRSGSTYVNRGLQPNESRAITNALKARVDQAKLTYEQN